MKRAKLSLKEKIRILKEIKKYLEKPDNPIVYTCVIARTIFYREIEDKTSTQEFSNYLIKADEFLEWYSYDGKVFAKKCDGYKKNSNWFGTSRKARIEFLEKFIEFLEKKEK